LGGPNYLLKQDFLFAHARVFAIAIAITFSGRGHRIPVDGGHSSCVDDGESVLRNDIVQ